MDINLNDNSDTGLVSSFFVNSKLSCGCAVTFVPNVDEGVAVVQVDKCNDTRNIALYPRWQLTAAELDYHPLPDTGDKHEE